jgi:hypothetical protein
MCESSTPEAFGFLALPRLPTFRSQSHIAANWFPRRFLRAAAFVSVVGETGCGEGDLARISPLPEDELARFA